MGYRKFHRFFNTISGPVSCISQFEKCPNTNAGHALGLIDAIPMKIKNLGFVGSWRVRTISLVGFGNLSRIPSTVQRKIISYTEKSIMNLRCIFHAESNAVFNLFLKIGLHFFY